MGTNSLIFNAESADLGKGNLKNEINQRFVGSGHECRFSSTNM